MAIAFLTHVEYRPWRGFEDPALPAGFWVADGVDTGDATGGLHTIDHIFRAAGDPLSGRLFSMDSMTVTVGTATSFDAVLVVTGFDWLAIPNRRVSSRSYSVHIVTNTVAGAPRYNRTPRNLFLGPMSGQVGISSSSISLAINNVDGQGFSFFAQGYWWDVGAITAPGGPQRPATSLFL